MSIHSHTTIGNLASKWSPRQPTHWGSRFVLAVTLLAGLFMTASGLAALLAPGWFADAAGFPRHTHFVHDAGAFQLGIGPSSWPGSTTPGRSAAMAWRNTNAPGWTACLGGPVGDRQPAGHR
jgi:hypothetical protein